MFIATLIAADRLSSGDISLAQDAMAAAGAAPSSYQWVEPDKAHDFFFAERPEEVRGTLEGLIEGVDLVLQPEAGRRKKLLIADMDSTMITVECIDELADYAGLKAEVAAVTERAMRGELAFEEALTERVALLRGLDDAILDRCHAERVRIMSGAIPLVRTMKRNGAYCLLVSGGFTRFADKVATEIGFDRAISNRLGIEDGKLQGIVALPIVGAQAKRQALVDTAEQRGLSLDQCLAVGDGANDIPMLEAAGLGIAYHAKPAAAAAADARIEHSDLGALLYAQGYPKREWQID
ncbi:phosphoserine phosphatase SerB [Sphingosinicella rhizophila]|uniref:Phosphoserine phosphatase n=1 Tax=Sphingosinicella rhizophila TaxID=3050082 RepID=A0ABU3Q3C0_9SPHN|nr:phosphoserine phosphatase SerB [Sphingosinicella sp. GR2756]MDT9597807.1 phosphoserine phosphatase SerB [Sphingosinicella sp. GR2756]